MDNQQIPSNQLRQRIVVITGANSGLGYGIADSLYKQGATIIFGARSQQKNKKAVQQITDKYQTQNLLFPHRSIVGFHLDLADRISIQQFAEQVGGFLGKKSGSRNPHIDILINNAAILGADNLELVEEKIQKSLYVNYFGHFYLTYLLFPYIAQAQSAKIINLTSDISLKIVQCQQNQNLNAGEYAEQNMWDLSCSHKKYDSFEQYAVSKLFNHMFSVQIQNIANQFNQACPKAQNKTKILQIKSGAIHPGFIDTTFGDHNLLVQDIKKKYGNLMISSEEGAKGIVALCSKIPSEFVDDYYGENGNKKLSNQISRKADKTRQLWEVSEKIYGIDFRARIKQHGLINTKNN